MFSYRDILNSRERTHPEGMFPKSAGPEEAMAKFGRKIVQALRNIPAGLLANKRFVGRWMFQNLAS